MGQFGRGEVQQGRILGDDANLRIEISGGGTLSTFKSYKFAAREDFPKRESQFLSPPFGDNLLSLLRTNRQLRSVPNDLFSPIGLRLGLRPQEHKIELIKDYEDVVVSYPYGLASDTMQRLVFYLCAILSNKDSVLIFEEPEAHAFPYYTKFLAESIGLDENANQYFMSTHNPYFLMPLIEKTPKGDLAVFITYLDDYQTKVRPLTEAEIEESMEFDIFGNLEIFLEAD